MKRHIGIAGAGFSGSVLARELAESGHYRVTVYDEHMHVAGNCYTERDSETDIMIHMHGPHFFHTNCEEIWNYINGWGKFQSYLLRVKSQTAKGIFSFPINLLTLNQFFQKKLSPAMARDFMGSICDETVKNPKNLADVALKYLGKDLYHTFIQGPLKKQWGVDPSQLNPDLGIPHQRFNYDDHFYNHKYQGLPISGYTEIIRRILDHQDITVRLGQRLEPHMKDQFDHVFWSGPLDGFFNFKFGRLAYRTLKFERLVESGDHQGCPIINFCEEEIPFTRVVEFKHLTPWEEHEKTVCFKEYSKICQNEDIPSYPVASDCDRSMSNKYRKHAELENKVTFIGRLGTYRYLEMDKAIAESLALAKYCLSTDMKCWPKFSDQLS